MQPNPRAEPGFVVAFGKIVKRIAEALSETPESELPIKMFVFGGAAVHLYTGERVSNDIDAAFSRRFMLPNNLEAAYQASDGTAKLLYFDRQFSDAFSLVHEDAFDESIALGLTYVDSGILDVRLLSALDIATSKISRLAGYDYDDIAALARCRLIDSESLRRRAEEASKDYVGNLDRLKTSIELAVNIVSGIEGRQIEAT